MDRIAELPEGLLAPLLEASEAEGFRFLRRVLTEWAAGSNRFSRDGEALLGAFLDGRLVAICGLSRDPYQDDPSVGRLRNLYVLPEHRGRGFGAALTRKVIDLAASSFHLLRLRAATPEAAAFYERLGLAPTAGVPDCTHALRLDSQPRVRIERLGSAQDGADLQALAGLLVEAVESGAAVSFLSPLAVKDAERWWAETISAARPGSVFLAARDGERIVGTVQLHPAWAPNQPHRAEIAKLIVAAGARGSGLGTRLMERIEEEARHGGFRLLTLDAKSGTAAERLYRRLGWTAVGAIPRYALDPDGKTPHDAVIFYKELEREEAR